MTRRFAAAQNPQNVQVKEELVRLGKRLKAAERELEEKRNVAAARQEKVARLEGDLEKIKAGGAPLQWAAWRAVSLCA